MCTALMCGAKCSMPARLGHWQSQTSSVCSETTGQWSVRSAMSDHKTLSPPGPMSYLCGLALRIWTSFWRREDSDGMDMWNALMVQSRQPLTYRLMESMGLGGPRWHGKSWQRGIAESGSSRPSALMIDIPGDLVWDLPCLQQDSYLEGGPLVWMLPLYLHVNQKSDYDMNCHQILLLNKSDANTKVSDQLGCLYSLIGPFTIGRVCCRMKTVKSWLHWCTDWSHLVLSHISVFLTYIFSWSEDFPVYIFKFLISLKMYSVGWHFNRISDLLCTVTYKAVYQPIFIGWTLLPELFGLVYF